MSAHTVMRWISSPAGPLVFFPRGTPAREFSDLTAGAAPLTHVVFGCGSGVILADGFDTTWWSLPAQGGGILVRRLWARTEADVMRAVRAVPESAWTEESRVIDAGSGALILADLRGTADQQLEVFLRPGRYAISNANLEPDINTCVMLHRLLPLM